MRLLFALVFVSLYTTQISSGQGNFFDPLHPIQNISLSQWTAEDGLSSNNATHIFQDSRGLLWVTSFNGVMIYDGERFEIYDINNLEILETDGFYTVVEDDQGVVFLGSQGSGVIRYESGVFSKLSISSGELPKSVPALLMSKTGALYVGSNNQGLFKYDKGKASKVDIPKLNKSTISNIKEDREGKLWIATEGQGVFCVANGLLEAHYTVNNGLRDNYVESLACLADGRIMIASIRGLQFVDNTGKLQTVDAFNSVYINYLLVDQWGSVWIGTENGLARWSPKHDKVEWIYGRREIDLVRISSIIIDQENSIWLSSSREGLMRLKESKLSNLTEPNLTSNRVNIVHESWDQSFYIGTDQNQLDVYKDDGEFKVIDIETDLGGNGVRDIYHDRDGSLWLATYVGIIHKNGATEVLYSTANGMPANNFRTILKDRTGTFWFGSRSGGLVKFRDGKILEVLNNNNKLESNFVLSVTESPNGDLYVGTHSGGMTILKPSGQVDTYHLKADDSGVLFFNIDLISENSALITANIGLVQFDGDSLKLIHLMSDQRSKTYFDLIDDKKNSFWLTTNLGVLQIDKSSWQQYLDKQIEQLPYLLFDENNGMNNKECTGATRSLLTSQGKVMIPTLGGVCEVNPSKLTSNTEKPSVLIRKVLVDNQEVKLDEKMSDIEPGALRYIFEFAVLSYTAPERNQFKYKLDGFENQWSDAVYDGRVEYTNLPPGKYNFRVIGANGSSIWNDEGASFAFRVKPFFYQTYWFYLLIFFSVIGVFLMIYQWRISFINRQNVELKKVNAELDRFVYSASHEIRSPLSSILGLIHLARLGDSDKRLEYFDHIEKSVNRLDEFIHDIVDYSRNARLGIQVNEVDFETIITNILSDISHTSNFDAIRCEKKYNQQHKFYSDSSRVKVVLSNIITNAFKHHQPNRVDDPVVSIEVTEVSTGIRISVRDNGPGIDKKDQPKVFNMFYRATTTSEGSGLGLYIVEETIEKLQGSVKVESNKNQGSVFTITLKNLEALLEK